MIKLSGQIKSFMAKGRQFRSRTYLSAVALLAGVLALGIAHEPYCQR